MVLQKQVKFGLLAATLFFAVALSGCIQQGQNSSPAPQTNVQDQSEYSKSVINGFELYHFSKACQNCNSISDCENEKSFCESKNLSVSLVKGAGNSMTLYPEKSVTCSYYCVNQEQLSQQKKTSPNANYGVCVHEPKNTGISFSLSGIHKDLVDLNFYIILLNKEGRTLEFVSAIGKEGFSGTMQTTKEGNLTDAGYWVFLDGLKNVEAGKDTQKGVIEITYKENGIEKKYTTTCNYPKT